MGDLLGNGGFCQLGCVEISTGELVVRGIPAREASFGGVGKHLQFYYFQKSRCLYRVF